MERMILTAQSDAQALALTEAGKPQVLRELNPGVVLCQGAAFSARPVFVRHICPAQTSAVLNGSWEDLGELLQALGRIRSRIQKEKTFSVQTRILDGLETDYKRFDVNTALAEALCGEGLILDVKTPEQIVSVTLSQGEAYLGVSTPEENLSDWAGGMRRYKKEEDQISRAEFKLLEALETFQIPLPEGGRALDLGAAPGGWTRVLRQKGFEVTAVDPAMLDARLLRDAGVHHAQMTAQTFFAAKQPPFDILVNDMKMDSRVSATLMAEAAECLKPGGWLVLTLKLPERPVTWPGRVQQAIRLLEGAYDIQGARQLFHNRSEVTLVAKRKSDEE